MKKKRNRAKVTGKKSVKENRLLRITVIAVVTLVCAVLMFFTLNAQNKVFLRLDGIEVREEEYRWAMFSARNDVLAELNARGVLQVAWNEQTDLGMPYEMVAERAVEILKEYYATASLAVECGYLKDSSFESLKNELAAENEGRAQAIAAGEIITGLSSYDLNQYIQYRASAIRRQYCDDDANPGMNVTEEDMLQLYERDKQALYRQEDDLELRYIEIYTGTMALTEKEHAELEQEVEILRQKTVTAGSMEEALEEAPGLLMYYQTLEIDSGSYAAYARAYSDVLSYSEELQTGDVSAVISESGWIFLIECAERVKHGYLSFESLISTLKRSVQEDRYDAIIDERSTQIEAIYNARKLYLYTAEQLG